MTKSNGSRWGGFFPRPGQVETTRTTEASELWTPVKIAVVLALGIDVSVLAFYLVTLVIVLWDSGFRSFWSWYSESFWGWPLMCVLSILAWPLSLGFVAVYRLAPEIKNRNWPPTYKALEPFVGLVTAYTNMKDKASDLDAAYESFHRWDDEEDANE